MSALRKVRFRRPAPSETDLLVYSGRDAVGAVSLRRGSWLALDIDGRAIGRFATRLAAFAAVLREDSAP